MTKAPRKQNTRRQLSTIEAMTQRGVAEENQRIYQFTLRHGPTHAGMHFNKTTAEIEAICLAIETKR